MPCRLCTFSNVMSSAVETSLPHYNKLRFPTSLFAFASVLCNLFGILYENSLANSPKVCYTETAPQLNMNLKTWLQLRRGVSFFPCSQIQEKVVAQHIGILSAGVPNVERPYFLPANIKFKGETEVEQDKKKILSDLYAIRATMSLIAENDEKNAEPERQAIISLKQEQQKDQYVLETSKEEIGNWLQEAIERHKHYVHENEKSYKSAKEELNHSFIYHLWWTLWEGLYTYAALGLILLLFTFASIGVSFGCGSLWNDLDYWHGVLYNAIICFSVIVAYLLFICIPLAILERRSWMEHTQTEKLELQKRTQELQEETELYEVTRKRAAEETDFWHGICQTATASEHLAPRIIQLFEWHEEKIIEIEQKKENLEQQKNLHYELLKANGEEVSAIVESATKAYPLIDFRDWENVDLLIYYFETGRADDMKEALQLVDRQRQTEMLAKAIAMASAEICKTIHHSMNQLGNALAQSFSLLSSQMTRQHNELLSEIEEQAAAQKEVSEAQIKEIRAQTAAQFTSQQMNRALLEKISDSSSDLAKQMHRQMREVHGIYV